MARRLIALDASGLSPQPAGADRYTLSLIRALARVDTDHDYVVYACDFSLPELSDLGGRFRLVETGPWPPGGRRIWQEAGLAFDLIRRRASLLHSPNQITPRLAPCPRVVTLYDVAPFLLSDAYDAEHRRALEAAASRAAAILAPSESSATDIVNLLPVARSRTHVTYVGVDTTFRRLNPEQSAAITQERYGLAPGYLLNVGADHPAKNRRSIFLTLRRLLDQGRDLRLAIAGEGGSTSQDQLIEEYVLRDRVTFCGFVPQQDLPALYNSASALLHPVLHDGLGLSVLEAMACSAPVIVSDRGTPAELAGEAGILVDPNDVEAMAKSVAMILDDSSHTTRLRFDGLKRAADFSWEACAERTLAVYRRVLGED